MQYVADAAAMWITPSGAMPPAVFLDFGSIGAPWMIAVGALIALGLLLPIGLQQFRRFVVCPVRSASVEGNSSVAAIFGSPRRCVARPGPTGR